MRMIPIWTVLWLACFASQIAQAERRLALVIANDTYASLGRLQAPLRDAALVGEALEKVGFDVRRSLNLTKVQTLARITEFLDEVRKQDDTVAYFYYSGHAAQIDDENYLLATDVPANTQTVDQLRMGSVSLNTILLELERANKRGLTFLVADGCRDNPLLRMGGGTRALSSFKPIDLGRLVPGKGAAVLLSAQPDSLSEDGTDKGSSFAIAHARNSTVPGLQWEEFARRVQNDVVTQTGGTQKPDILANLGREFYFVAGSTPRVADLSSDTRAARSYVQDSVTGTLKPTYDESHALLIGVSRYKDSAAWRELPGVPHDLRSVRDVLTMVHKFKTAKIVSDPTADELIKEMREFIAVYGAMSNARLLIYYAGHGHMTKRQDGGDGVGWLVPSDAPSASAAPQRFAVTAINLRRIQEWSEIIDAKHVLWIFDSCFSGQAIGMIGATRLAADGAFERERLSKPVRRVITSGSADEEVPDRSIFADLFVQALRGEHAVGSKAGFVTGSELGDFLKRNVAEEIAAKGGRKQSPQSDLIVYPSLKAGDIIFRIEPDLANSASAK